MIVDGGKYKIVKPSLARLRQVTHLLNSRPLTNEELHYRIITCFALVRTPFGYRYLTRDDFEKITTVLSYQILEYIHELYDFGNEILEEAYCKHKVMEELRERLEEESVLLDKSLQSLGFTYWTCDFAKLPQPILELWVEVANLEITLLSTHKLEDTDADIAKLQPLFLAFANRIEKDFIKLLLVLFRLLLEITMRQTKAFLRNIRNEQPPPLPITVRPQLQPNAPALAV
jgi:hypothetical protein